MSLANIWLPIIIIIRHLFWQRFYNKTESR